MTDDVADMDDDAYAEGTFEDSTAPEVLIAEAVAAQAVAAKTRASFPAAIPAQKDSNLNKIAKDKMTFDRWMHRFSIWSGAGAVGATGVAVGFGLATTFAIAAAPVVVPAALATAAGLGAFAVGSSIVRRIAVTGRRRKHYKDGGYVPFGDVLKI